MRLKKSKTNIGDDRYNCVLAGVFAGTRDLRGSDLYKGNSLYWLNVRNRCDWLEYVYATKARGTKMGG